MLVNHAPAFSHSKSHPSGSITSTVAPPPCGMACSASITVATVAFTICGTLKPSRRASSITGSSSDQKSIDSPGTVQYPPYRMPAYVAPAMPCVGLGAHTISKVVWLRRSAISCQSARIKNTASKPAAGVLSTLA